jgi:hypothetical protein
MKKLIFSSWVLLLVLAAANSAVFAQTTTDKNAELEKELMLARRDLRADKKKIIAMNVPLTEAEATKFWPVYDEYTAEMAKHYDQVYAVIKDYAANQKTLTDAQAIDMVKRWSKIQIELAQTRLKWVPMFEKVVPGKKAAQFFQVDRRLYALMDIQVAAEVPLVLQ